MGILSGAAASSSSRQNVHSSNDQNRSLNIAISQTEDLIELGQFSLLDLKKQRGLMQNAQKKALAAIETLGISRATMKRIAIRLKSDTFIFYGGIVFILFLLWILLRK